MTISASVTVQDGSGSPIDPTGVGADVTAGATITVRLADPSGVDIWQLSVIGTDETSSAPVLTINSTTKTATYGAPGSAGTATLFRSRAISTNGRDPVTGRSPYVVDSQFVVHTLVTGKRVVAINETFEANASFGWAAKINPLIRGTGGGGSTLFALDFTAATLGAMANATFVSNYALAFARASAATVQTSAVAIDSTPSTDVPRFGANGATGIRGLVIEESRTNVFLNARDGNGSSWAAGLNTTTTSAAGTSPDGTTNATRHQPTSGGFTKSGVISPGPGAVQVVGSMWVKATSANSPYYYRYGSGSDSGRAQNGTATSSWALVSTGSILSGAGTGDVSIYPSDPLDASGSASDILVDLCQLEVGQFRTEAIVTVASSVTRAGDHLSDSSASRWASSGRIAAEFVFAPKGTPTQYTANAYFWYVDANNNAWMDTSQKINVKVGGTTVTSASAISWTAGQVVSLWIEAGGGTNCKVEYRTSSDGGSTYGSVTTLLNTALAGTLAPSTIDIFGHGTANQMTAYVKTITAYSTGHAAAWVV